MTVSLRKRNKGKKISLYLDYYEQGKHEYEYLKIYLHPEPKEGKLTKEQKSENRTNLLLAENIKAKRHLQIQNGIYDFQDTSRLDGSFVAYIESLMEKRKDSRGNYDNWDSMLKHLKRHSNGDITFRHLDSRCVQSFKSYLIKAKTSAGKPLSQNTKHSYFNKFKAAIREATNEGIISKNPAIGVEGVKSAETQREFLTHDELESMAKADCEIPILRSAFLFSALTGLRWSDINKLVWSEVQYSSEYGHYLRFRQRKTQAAETLPISAQAAELLGERQESTERVFQGLKYSSWHNIKLQQWAFKAGISKTVTFHCARHSYATLQLTLGTDIYTVSKLLGHKDIKTTQIYAKVINENKRLAADKIKLSI